MRNSGGGGPPGGQPPAAPVAAAPGAPNNGRGLIGKEPTIFNGAQSRSEAFIQEFELYAHINEDHHSIQQPYRRIFLALSYMKGPKIDDWVRLMIEQTALRVNGNANNVPLILPVNNRDDQDLWIWFVRAFRMAFTDTTRSEDALSKLLAIKMQGEDLDTYIATFNHLRDVAQWERDSRGTILLFRRGLNPALAQAIINRTIPRPVTFDDWANAA